MWWDDELGLIAQRACLRMPGTSGHLSKNGDKPPLSLCSVQLSIGWSVGHGPIAEQISWCQSDATSLWDSASYTAAETGSNLLPWDGSSFVMKKGLINAFKVIFSSKEERYTVKRDVFTGQHFITQMSCCSEEWTPSANQEESPVSTKTSFFSERINAAHVLKLQPPRHHILLIFVSLIQAAFSTVFYEDIRFHIKSLEGFPSAYWLRWPT